MSRLRDSRTMTVPDRDTTTTESHSTGDSHSVVAGRHSERNWSRSTRRTLLKALGVGSAVAFGLAGSASADYSEQSATPTQEDASETSLLYQFQAIVTEGASEERFLGRLELTKTVDGVLSGTLTLTNDTGSDTRELPVTGQLADGNITLTINLEPVTIDSVAGSFLFTIRHGTEPDGFRGTFVGPESGDSGRWEAIPPSLSPD